MFAHTGRLFAALLVEATYRHAAIYDAAEFPMARSLFPAFLHTNEIFQELTDSKYFLSCAVGRNNQVICLHQEYDVYSQRFGYNLIWPKRPEVHISSSVANSSVLLSEQNERTFA
jgi:hypothetical protein